jgi:hypothetical protein
MRANFQGDSTATRRTKHLSYRFVVGADCAVSPYSNQKLGRRDQSAALNSSRPSRGDSFPPVLVMEAAENHASHNLAVLGKGMFVVILQRWEYPGTFRNPRSEAQMRAPLVVMSNPL